ncbi:phosphoglycerate mutase [Shewanella sp. NFH-SH190041]|nr:phosphoglycerate mutase [Shewanella sp. NFH-SH190041]
MIFLRHGACEGGEILRGQTDVALSPQGWMQMQKRVDGLMSAHGRPGLIVSSDRRRCREFAAQQASELAVTLAVDAGFAEMDYGDWDGLTFAEIERNDSEAFAAFYRDPWQNPPPNGEATVQFERRVQQAFDRICQQLFTPEGLAPQAPVWVVCHGGVMLSLMGHVLGLSQQPGVFSAMALPYAAAMQISVIRHEGRFWPRLHWPG